MVCLKTDLDVCQFAISLIDNTSLNLDDTEEAITQLLNSSLSIEPHTASICIYPKFIKFAKSKYPEFRVATVVNFPKGEDKEEDVIALTKQAVVDGADEIDMVVNYKSIIENKTKGLIEAKKLIEAVRQVCPEPVLLKVIIESGELKTEDLIESTSNIAIEAGADFIKTSTGKVPINATIETAQIMIKCIKQFHYHYPKSTRIIGFKPAGGVKTVEQTRQFLELAQSIMGDNWLSQRTFRFGASSLLKVLRSTISGDTTTQVTSGY
jgi:deoxyribose-phosphate aldolase